MATKKKGNKARLFEVQEEAPKASMMPVLPKGLAGMPSAKSVAAGDYQKKLARHFAPEILPRAFQSLVLALDEGDPIARKQALEMYGVLQTKVGGNSFVVNLNNQTNVDARSDGSGREESTAGLDSFEEIARTVSAERQKRIPGSGENIRPAIPAQFEATPED